MFANKCAVVAFGVDQEEGVGCFDGFWLIKIKLILLHEAGKAGKTMTRVAT